MTEQELLAQLRDVHLPEQPGWWPPAIGWWVLALVLTTLLAAALLFWRRWRANAWRRAALREHHRLQSAGASMATVRALSVLMRRVALRVEPRQNVASATDQQWLQTLDRIGNTRDYTNGVGGLLAVWPYRNITTIPANELAGLFSLTRATVQRATKPRPNSPSSMNQRPSGHGAGPQSALNQTALPPGENNQGNSKQGNTKQSSITQSSTKQSNNGHAPRGGSQAAADTQASGNMRTPPAPVTPGAPRV